MGSGDGTAILRDARLLACVPIDACVSELSSSSAEIACWSPDAPAAYPRLVRCTHFSTPWHGEHHSVAATRCAARGPIAVRTRPAECHGGAAVSAMTLLVLMLASDTGVI
jgi:hypothetical protein